MKWEKRNIDFYKIELDGFVAEVEHFGVYQWHIDCPQLGFADTYETRNDIIGVFERAVRLQQQNPRSGAQRRQDWIDIVTGRGNTEVWATEGNEHFWVD